MVVFWSPPSSAYCFFGVLYPCHLWDTSADHRPGLQPPLLPPPAFKASASASPSTNRAPASLPNSPVFMHKPESHQPFSHTPLSPSTQIRATSEEILLGLCYSWGSCPGGALGLTWACEGAPPGQVRSSQALASPAGLVGYLSICRIMLEWQGRVTWDSAASFWGSAVSFSGYRGILSVLMKN